MHVIHYSWRKSGLEWVYCYEYSQCWVCDQNGKGERGREHPEWSDSVKGCERGYDVMLIFPFYRQGGGTFCVAPETMINIPAFPRGPENEEIKNHQVLEMTDHKTTQCRGLGASRASRASGVISISRLGQPANDESRIKGPKSAIWRGRGHNFKGNHAL
jgi:hypothetical protein